MVLCGMLSGPILELAGATVTAKPIHRLESQTLARLSSKYANRLLSIPQRARAPLTYIALTRTSITSGLIKPNLS